MAWSLASPQPRIRGPPARACVLLDQSGKTPRQNPPDAIQKLHPDAGLSLRGRSPPYHCPITEYFHAYFHKKCGFSPAQFEFLRHFGIRAAQIDKNLLLTHCAKGGVGPDTSAKALVIVSLSHKVTYCCHT